MNLQNTNLLETLPAIRRKSPDSRTILFSDTIGELDVFKFLKAGARGSIAFAESHTDFVKAIQTVHRGELWVSRKQMASFFDSEVIEQTRHDDTLEITKAALTPREKEILKYLATGCTNKKIADTLFISEKTVRCHLNSIYKKLNVTRRVDATLYAINNGLT